MNYFNAYIALGGNIGDVAETMLKALTGLSTIGIIAKCSSLYKTPPWGYEEQNEFFNSCIILQTNLLPEDLLNCCQNLEKVLGRERNVLWGPRKIDLDLLYHEAIGSYKSNSLTLPHPHMFERAFVLVPLVEIAPELLIKNYTIKNYLDKLKREDREKILLDKTNKTWKTIV